VCSGQNLHPAPCTVNPEPGATSLHHQEVPVWFRRTEHLTARDIAHADGTLSASERARADRFRFPDARRDYVIAHDLLRRSLSRYGSIAPAAWQFDVGAHGRPFLRRAEGQPPIFFSLTHTTGLVACAIAREPWVGVDVERTSRTLTRLDIGARILSPVEAHALDR